MVSLTEIVIRTCPYCSSVEYNPNRVVANRAVTLPEQN